MWCFHSFFILSQVMSIPEKVLKMDANKPEELNKEECFYIIEQLEDTIREINNDNDNDKHERTKLTKYLSDVCRCYLLNRFELPYVSVVMTVKFPDEENEEKIIFDTAPFNDCPYSVFYFVRLVDNWTDGWFHRNANHVQQGKPVGKFHPLVFQEYSEFFPHVKYSLGFAGRPGGPQFYISMKDNTRCHGPGSQRSTTNEADSCFGIIHDKESKDIVERFRKVDDKGFVNRGFKTKKEVCVVIVGFEFQ